MTQKERVQAALAAYFSSIAEPEDASRIVVYQFDVFMYDKQVKQVDKGVQFRSYLPKDSRLRNILDVIKPTTLTPEDSEIVKTLMKPDLRKTLPQIKDHTPDGYEPADLIKRIIAEAKLTPFYEWIYRTENELDIPADLQPWADEASEFSRDDIVKLLRDKIQPRVLRAAQEFLDPHEDPAELVDPDEDLADGV